MHSKPEYHPSTFIADPNGHEVLAHVAIIFLLYWRQIFAKTVYDKVGVIFSSRRLSWLLFVLEEISDKLIRAAHQPVYRERSNEVTFVTANSPSSLF